MKRIGIDARLYSKTGVGVYIRNLLYYLQQGSPEGIQFYIYLMPQEFDTVTFSSDAFIKRKAPFHWHSISEQFGYLSALRNDDLDLMHFTYFSFPVRYERRFIATVHDTILLDHKTGKASTKNSLLYALKHRAFQYVFATQLKNAARIITPTESVKKNISRIFGIQYEKKIVALAEGVSYEMMNIQEKTPEGIHSSDDFLLYVGNFYPHKNVERLVNAYGNIQTQSRLLLVGPDDYFAQRMRQYITSLHLDERISLVSNLSNDQLAYCYRHARALVHPSLDEGFGLPLIEAAYYNLPIIASDIPVYREILGTAYSAFNPTDEEDIIRKIEECMRAPRIPSYETILRRYSFQAMTQKILAIYQELL